MAQNLQLATNLRESQGSRARLGDDRKVFSLWEKRVTGPEKLPDESFNTITHHSPTDLTARSDTEASGAAGVIKNKDEEVPGVDFPPPLPHPEKLPPVPEPVGGRKYIFRPPSHHTDIIWSG